MFKIAAIALGAALATTTAAFAGPTLSVGQQITVSAASVVGAPVTISAPVSTSTVAGPIFLQTNVGGLLVWCIDLYHEILTTSGQNLHYQAGTATTDFAPTPKTLTALQQQEIEGLAVYGTDLYNSGKASTNELAAVQLAIWKVENPTLSYSGADANLTNADIAMAPSLRGRAGALIAKDGTQSFVTTAVNVPEPVSLTLMMTGLVALGLVRRRA